MMADLGIEEAVGEVCLEAEFVAQIVKDGTGEGRLGAVENGIAAVEEERLGKRIGGADAAVIGADDAPFGVAELLLEDVGRDAAAETVDQRARQARQLRHFGKDL